MSEENIETVRRSAAAFNRGDLDAWIECWADDIDYRAVEGAPDDHGPILGKDALRDYAQDWRNTFDDFRQEPVEQIDAGDDKVIAVFRVSGRAKLSGVETDLTYTALYTFRDGKIARCREYWTRDEAFEAAGLSRLLLWTRSGGLAWKAALARRDTARTTYSVSRRDPASFGACKTGPSGPVSRAQGESPQPRWDRVLADRAP